MLKKNALGGGNPLVEVLTYCVFISNRAFGRRRKNPVTVELVGSRGGRQRFAIKGNKLPPELETIVELELNTDDYNNVLEQLRRSGKK